MFDFIDIFAPLPLGKGKTTPGIQGKSRVAESIGDGRLYCRVIVGKYVDSPEDKTGSEIELVTETAAMKVHGQKNKQ
jgi:hypothetical protein